MNSRERILTALNHKKPDRVPIDFGSFPGATSMNVRAYQNFLDYLGIRREVKVANILMFTAEIDDDILDRFHVDTKSIKPSLALADFNAPEEFIDRPWAVKWRRSTDFTYATIEGPFQKIETPSLEDLKNFPGPNLQRWRILENGEKKPRRYARRPIKRWLPDCRSASFPWRSL